MRILGADPGLSSKNETFGWARVTIDGARPWCERSGGWQADPYPDWHDRVDSIVPHFESELDGIDLVSFESYTYQGPRTFATNLMRINYLIGKLSAICDARGIPMVHVTTMEAKAALGLRGKCDKKRVRKMVELILDGNKPKNNHGRDAVVAAVAGERKYRLRQLLEKGRVA